MHAGNGNDHEELWSHNTSHCHFKHEDISSADDGNWPKAITSKPQEHLSRVKANSVRSRLAEHSDEKGHIL